MHGETVSSYWTAVQENLTFAPGRYKLLHPSSEYQAVYQSSLKKIELCRTLTTSAHHVDVDIDRALANSNSASLSADDLQAESKFVLSQIKVPTGVHARVGIFVERFI